MFGRDVIDLLFFKTHADEQRVPVRHMVRDQQDGAVGLQVLMLQVEFKTDEAVGDPIEEAPDVLMPRPGKFFFK